MNKNHVALTADRAWLVRKQVPGIKVFGGITLNGAVGGLNPRAVELNEAAGITRDQIQTMGRETPPRS